MGHCQKNDLTSGSCVPEYEFQGCSPGRGLQYPGGRPADRDQAGGSAGSPHHQGGDAGGGDPLRHRDHPVQRVHQGTTKTLQEGENGLRRVTMQNVYDTNGVLLEQTILSTETIREPVNKKVVVGTKKVTKNGAAAYIGGSGQFIWPVRGTATARAGMAAATRAWISVPLPVRPSMHRRAAP